MHHVLQDNILPFNFILLLFFYLILSCLSSGFYLICQLCCWGLRFGHWLVYLFLILFAFRIAPQINKYCPTTMTMPAMVKHFDTNAIPDKSANSTTVVGIAKIFSGFRRPCQAIYYGIMIIGNLSATIVNSDHGIGAS